MTLISHKPAIYICWIIFYRSLLFSFVDQGMQAIYQQIIQVECDQND